MLVIGGRGGFIARIGGGSLSKSSMESKDGLGGRLFAVVGERSSSMSKSVLGKVGEVENKSSVGSKFMASGEECLDGWVGAGEGEVKGGGVVFGVSRILLDVIPGDIIGESGEVSTAKKILVLLKVIHEMAKCISTISVKLWSLVKERFSSSNLTKDKEIALWVDLKRLFKPDEDDELWKFEFFELIWRLYDLCGVHHISTRDGQDIFMLVEKGVSIVKKSTSDDVGSKATSR
uniref:Leucine-rich repeat protein n=1 Tax=Tanacetum cinerariifolium TaxID=118510 RepID=A0A6L2N5E0_TANCI|nr:leucine-rich repeat protein [Tanacetum cinerariifolium]